MPTNVKTPAQVQREIVKSLKTNNLKPREKVKVKDPFTGKTALVTIDRTGYNEQRLIKALADPKKTRDQKDLELSMYAFQRGAESMSFLIDLARSKGEHTKETRVFKSQMRFDFEMLVDQLVQHFNEQAERTAAILKVDLEKEIRDYRAWVSLKNNKNGTYADFSRFRSPEAAALISQAMFDLAEAQLLMQSRDAITNARTREKGGGIYVDGKGNVYSVNDPEVDDIIKQDRESTRDIEAE